MNVPSPPPGPPRRSQSAVGTALRATIICPHCNAPALIRTSEQVSRTVKHLLMICLNEDCGHTWKQETSPIYTLSPSAIPHPDVDIPMAPDDILRRRYPEPGRKAVHDPNQISVFDWIGYDPGEEIGAPP